MAKTFSTILFFTVFLLINVVLEWPDKYIHLIFCDVGQGDAVLVTDGFTQMLIDGGRGTSVLDCLDENIPFWDREIEFVVATHADADHIGGLTYVLQNYQVNQILTTSLTKKTDDFGAFERALEEERGSQAKIISPKILDQITITNRVSGVVLSPQEEIADDGEPFLVTPETILSDEEATKSAIIIDQNDYNNWSISLFLTLDDVGVLLTGDLELEGEVAMVNSGLILDADILKVAHHGSKSSTSPLFLESFTPEDTVISAGENNSYGHPSPDVLNRLKSFGANIWRTDQQGTIEFLIDGSSYFEASSLEPVN